MATKCMLDLIKARASLTNILKIDVKLLHTTAPNWKVTSGRVKVTPRKTKPVTYEVFLKPHDIGRRKSWNSWNTSTIEGGPRPAETLFDDVFIRKFITGTFHDMVYSEVIIKRQHNIIRISMLLFPRLSPSKLCFLIGYTEEILSHWLQCLVKLEIQTISSPKNVTFKYV